MRRLVIAILSLSLCAGVQATDLPPHPFVSSAGHAEAWLAPDTGILRFEIGAMHADAQVANEAVLGQSEVLLNHFRSAGVDDADIEAWDIARKTVAVNKSEKVEAGTMQSLTRTFRIRVRDLTRWADIIAPLLGDFRADGVSVEFMRSDADSVRERLTLEAAADARARAAQLAGAVGRKLGEAVGVSVAPLDRLGVPFRLQAAPGEIRAASSPPQRRLTNAVPPALPFQADVHVLFKMK